MQRLSQNQQGFIHVYTGDGKGKTTAAIGLAVRAAGAGMQVFIGQFMKGQPYSELNSLRLLKPWISIEQFGGPRFVNLSHPADSDRQLAEAGLMRVRQILTEDTARLVVLDEINIAVSIGLLSLQKVLDVLQLKRPEVELVLTGRNAPHEFIKMADLVTDMTEIKHYYRNGILARKGIEE